MFRRFSFVGSQQQPVCTALVRQQPTAGLRLNTQLCRVLRCSFPPSTLFKPAHPLTRSLASSKRIKPWLNASPTSPLPATITTAAPSASSAPATKGSQLSSVLQPVFGHHATPLRLLSLLSLVFFCQLFVLDVFTGHGPSMLPTFALSGEVFLVEAVSRYTLLASPATGEWSVASLLAGVLGRLFSVSCGDVVLCSNPLRLEHSIAKRVIGLPGDVVRASLHEPMSETCVPAGHVWLQGDCLEASRDSREYGAVPLELVRGKVVAKVWPLSRAQWIERTLQYRGY